MAKNTKVDEFIEYGKHGQVKKSGVAVTEYVDDSREPPFIKLYTEHLLYLKDIPKHINPVLMAMLKRMPYGGQAFAINAAIKREMAKDLNCSAGTISNAITMLVRGDLLIRKDTGLYYVNPFFFGRGNWENVEKLRLEITYERTGRTFMAQVAHGRKQKQIEGQQSLLEDEEEKPKFTPLSNMPDIEYEDADNEIN